MKEWRLFIESEEKRDYFRNITTFLDEEYAQNIIYPKRDEIFTAFENCPLSEVKCVIIGQDPYFNPGEAHGLAFSVKDGTKIPPSLRNIYKELEDDLEIKRETGDLTGWSKSGVLLLNRVLTVRKGEPNSHKGIGWLEFTKACVEEVSKQEKPVVFMLWGGEARKLKKIIDSRHLILEAPHPSPLSSYRGFFGCKHFSKCNIFLSKCGRGEISWVN